LPSKRKDPNFRPDSSRCIYVTGRFDQQLIDRLTPQILALHAQSRKPITVYIDSGGGAISLGETLLSLLGAPNQDGEAPCNIITVVTSLAGSAAADMLSAGDYAIAYPRSTIVYHGTRMTLDDAITSETASSLTESLRLSNDRFAMRLAARSAWRFIFRYVYLKDQFNQHRAGRVSLTDLDCFLALLEERISDGAREVLTLSRIRFQRYKNLVTFFEKGLPKKRNLARVAEIEAIALKRMIEFELKRNKNPDWSLSDGGLVQITDDFVLLTEYVNTSDNRNFRDHCERWREFFLTPADKAEIAKLPAKQRHAKLVEKLRSVIQPVWLFFVAMCHVLQERDNVLTSTDAYWLGLIDEVLGLEELNFRLIMEGLPAARRRATRRRRAK
jgi:ATP-dependent protease ClpP protease subunit